MAAQSSSVIPSSLVRITGPTRTVMPMQAYRNPRQPQAFVRPIRSPWCDGHRPPDTVKEESLARSADAPTAPDEVPADQAAAEGSVQRRDRPGPRFGQERPRHADRHDQSQDGSGPGAGGAEGPTARELELVVLGDPASTKRKGRSSDRPFRHVWDRLHAGLMTTRDSSARNRA